MSSHYIVICWGTSALEVHHFDNNGFRSRGTVNINLYQRSIHIIRNVKVTSTSSNGSANYHPIYLNTHVYTLPIRDVAVKV